MDAKTTHSWLQNISTGALINSFSGIPLHEAILGQDRLLLWQVYRSSGLIVVLDRAILYCPFVPFSILFTRAVQLSDIADLDRLDRFANSLQPEKTPPEAVTHPYRLYKLLCQATRLYFDFDPPSRPVDPTIIHNLTDFWAEFDFAHSGVGAGAAADESLEAGGPQTYGLYDWCQDSQQIMGLLNEDVMF